MAGLMENTNFNLKQKIMKIYKTLYAAFFALIALLIANSLKAQYGTSRQTAIEAGALYPGAIFTNTQDNSPSFAGFDGLFPNGIFYKFTLTAATVVSISQTIISLKP